MNGKKLNLRLVDLGAVTRETRGGTRGSVDAERTLQPIAGLTAD